MHHDLFNFNHEARKLRLQSLTLEKTYYPTADEAIAFIHSKGIVADELIEFTEAWRVELDELQPGCQIRPIADGAIATYLKDADELEEMAADGFPKPTAAELKKIQAFAPKGITYSADELRVVELIGSDNLVQRSKEKWSLNCLKQMAKAYPGEQLIKNHDWFDSDLAMGLVFDAWLEGVEPSPAVLNRCGNNKVNKKIAANEGVWQLKLKVFFPADSDALKKIRYRQYYDLSTGGMWKRRPDFLCPHCFDENGNNLSIYSAECPHMPPGGYEEFFYGNDPDYKFADYVLVDGEIYPTEISTVVVGDIPGAAIA